MLTQDRLTAVTSSGCDLSLVLFDEIEKAAPAFTVLLLGILDKGTLNLGDNTVVNFERSLIFLTSNLGAREMAKEVQPDIGFQSADHRPPADIAGRLETSVSQRCASASRPSSSTASTPSSPIGRSMPRRSHASSITTSRSSSVTCTRGSATDRSRST